MGKPIRTTDDLTFTSRDAEGRLCWWDVTPPKTDYWHTHEQLGRAYGLEFLELIDATDKPEDLKQHAFSFIASAIVRRGTRKTDGAEMGFNDGLYIGFFNAISERLISGGQGNV